MTKNMEKKKLVEVAMVSIVSLGFATISLFINMADKLANFVESYGGLRIAEFFTYLIFLYLLGLLWVAYRGWRSTSKKHAELAASHGKLADLVTSITPALSTEAT